MHSPERPLDPPEPLTMSVNVDYEMWMRKDQKLSVLTEVLGGEAHWAGDEPQGETHRPAAGSTLIEEVESYDAAEEIVQNLVTEHLRRFVDLDTLVVTSQQFEVDEPDWDAIAKDRKIEMEDEG